jgi:hypothetical protein
MRAARSASPDVQPSTANLRLGDLRFHRLVPDDDWMRLPAAVRERFSKRLACGETVTYVGRVTNVCFSRLGWWLAQAARLVGGPLPVSRDVGVASAVTVTEEPATGGQTWTRMYARRRGFPQVIHSSKRFSGPTGLEEYVGRGILMTLDVAVEDGALTFKSAGYYLKLGTHRFRIPDLLSPGHLTVTHRDLGEGRFLFRLEVAHSRFGRLIDQSAVFTEATA